MVYIDSIKGGIIAFIVFVFAAILVPGQGRSPEVGLILTITTFLFAILGGFYITRSNSRFNGIREAVSLEDAHWLDLYKLAELYGPQLAKKFRDLIDKYYIVWFDFSLAKAYKHNAKYFFKVFEEIEKLKKSSKGANLEVFNEFLDQVSVIEENRNKLSVLAEERIGKSQWAVVMILAGIIVFSIFHLKTTGLFSQMVTVLLSTVLILVLLIIRDLQNLTLGGISMSDESGQEVFEFIGKPRYYHKKHLKTGLVKLPNYVKEYRLGLHEPGEKLKIKIIRRKTDENIHRRKGRKISKKSASSKK